MWQAGIPHPRQLAVAIAVGLSLALCALDGAWAGDATPCGDASAPACMGACPNGQACVSIARGGFEVCICRALGCCRTDAMTCVDGVTALECFFTGGGWAAGETCTGGCAGSPVNPDGSSCTDASQCTSGNCVDGVCCDTACDGANQACDLPGQSGQCATRPAAAPVASRSGLLIVLAALGTVAAGALRRAARR